MGKVVRIGSVLGGNKVLGTEIRGIDELIGLIRRGLPVVSLNYLVAHTGLDCAYAERRRTEPRRGRSRWRQGTRLGCLESDQPPKTAWDRDNIDAAGPDRTIMTHPNSVECSRPGETHWIQEADPSGPQDIAVPREFRNGLP